MEVVVEVSVRRLVGEDTHTHTHTHTYTYIYIHEYYDHCVYAP